MIKILKKYILFKEYLPLFFLLCFSGNPIISSEYYSKNLLVVYTFIFSFYIFYLVGGKISSKYQKRLTTVILGIVLLTIFQQITLGFVSYPGVFALVLKIILGLFTFIYYQFKKIDFLDIYIKLLVFLVITSIPFFIINQFGFYGISIAEGVKKSFLLYTSFNPENASNNIIRNSGMFWEPGAFAGYLILALVFIFIKNRRFKVGQYSKEVLWIFMGVLSTMSTTGYITLSIIIFLYLLQNYPRGRIIIIPFFVVITFFAYFNLDFLSKKIENQFISSLEMNNDDISNTRFGAFKMDLQYIKEKPLIGNGLHVKTRFRFHPWITEGIGHGNGMSNFLAYWGIPFFAFWLYCVYRFARNISQSSKMAFAALLIIILILQGEQFLNYPLFLSFFIISFSYKRIYVKNILQEKNLLK